MLGKVVLDSRKEEEIRKAKEDEDIFATTFPALAPSLDEIEVEEENIEEEIFFLWKPYKDLFDLYKILRNYLIEYNIDSSILLALIKDKNLPVEQTLRLIPYIHFGYITVILPKVDKNGGENNTNQT